MSIAAELESTFENFKTQAPPSVLNTFGKGIEEHVSTFDASKAPKAGDALPDFSLLSATGKTVTRADLLANGPIFIVFYRGGWCPFCNIALRGFQAKLPEFKAKGVRLVAISPELPDNSLSTKETNELEFEVLTDKGNEFARALNIVWKMPETFREPFGMFGNDIDARHGDKKFEVPVPTDLLVDKSGTIRNAFVEPNYVKRLEPATAVEWVNAL